MEITLIGTAHVDGRKKNLARLLLELNPSVIGVEYSSEMIKLNDESEKQRFLRWTKRTLKRNKVCEEFSESFIALLKKVDPEFEFSCAREYCQKYGVPLQLIDDPAFARKIKANDLKRATSKIKSMPGNKQIGAISSNDCSFYEESQRFYQIIKRLIKDRDYQMIDFHLAYIEDQMFTGAVGERDQYMANKVREIISQCPDSKLVCIVGGSHLLDDPKNQRTLYSKIKDLNPNRRLLGEPEIQY